MERRPVTSDTVQGRDVGETARQLRDGPGGPVGYGHGARDRREGTE